MHIAASAVALLSAALFLCVGVSAFVYHVKSQRRVPADVESSSLPGRATFQYYQHHDTVPPALDLNFPTPMVGYGGLASPSIKVLSPVFKPAPLLPPGLGRVQDAASRSPSARFRKMDPQSFRIPFEKQENTSSVISARDMRQHSYSPIVQSPLVPTTPDITPQGTILKAPPLNPLRLQYLPPRNASAHVSSPPSRLIAPSINVPSYHLPSRNNSLRTGTHSYAAWLTNVPAPLASWKTQSIAIPNYEDDLQTRRPTEQRRPALVAERNCSLASQRSPSAPRYLDKTKTLRLPTLSPLDRLAQAAVPIDPDGGTEQDLRVQDESSIALPTAALHPISESGGPSSRCPETPTLAITTPKPLAAPHVNYSLPRPQLRERPSFLYGSTSTLSLVVKNPDTAASDFASNINGHSDPSRGDIPQGYVDDHPKKLPMHSMQRRTSHRGVMRGTSPDLPTDALKPTTGAFGVSHRSPTLPEFNFSVNAVPLDIDIDLAPLLSPHCT